MSESRRCSVIRALHAAALALAFLAVRPAWAAMDWPDFRGPWHNGHAQAPDSAEPAALPLTWSETGNIAWKTAIPHDGLSTPVILNGQVWLTTATADGRESFALCLDAATGDTGQAEEAEDQRRQGRAEHPSGQNGPREGARSGRRVHFQGLPRLLLVLLVSRSGCPPSPPTGGGSSAPPSLQIPCS